MEKQEFKEAACMFQLKVATVKLDKNSNTILAVVEASNILKSE